MRRSPRGFKGRVIQSAPQLDDLLASEGVTVIDLSATYDSAERVGKVAQMLDQLLEYFQFQEDSEKLRLLILVEEAHLWTSKEVPKDAIRFLDNAVRLLRKKGVGVMLISQKISDFAQYWTGVSLRNELPATRPGAFPVRNNYRSTQPNSITGLASVPEPHLYAKRGPPNHLRIRVRQLDR
jgi:hypothetical protein